MTLHRTDAAFVAVAAMLYQLIKWIGVWTSIRTRTNECLKDVDSFQIVIVTVFMSTIITSNGRIRQTFRRWLRQVQAKGCLKLTKFVLFKIAGLLPSVQKKISDETLKTNQILKDEMLKEVKNEDNLYNLPDNGVSQTHILNKVKDWSEKEHKKWDSGKVSGGIYHGKDQFTAFLCQVYSMFALSNPLHPDVFPFVRKMESEIVAMTVALFHGDPQKSCGTISSGGTESILLSCKAYRDRALEIFGITRPEMIAPVTIHAAFEKAAEYFGIDLIHVPVDPVTMKADVGAVRRAITSNTVLIAASSPCFPFGIIDPIEELAGLASSYSIGFHVDCCLGSFLLPFLGDIGHPLPAFDFSVKGVTSISCDLHKYGYAPKGISCIMYNSQELRRFQYFSSVSWTGGIYASPTLAGSRPGALSAAAWAAMVALGKDGYRACARDIMIAAQTIKNGIREISELKLVGDPLMSVISFTAADPLSLNIYNVNEAMSKRGWMLNALQNPSSVHICLTNMHTGEVASKFIQDLTSSVSDVIANPKHFSNGSAAIYGMASAIPDGSIVDNIARSYIDMLFMN
uniref:sphinganine-1-phosphate aldolase n=1 Tax=Spongospora subterranea TaxID=70186 RepID=A0A0H5R866_9EUKA|eukprot:CRZ10323.1 hypothetical protein [Spongospora subterranea]